MKYMLLIHQGSTPTPNDQDAWNALSDDERNAVYAAYNSAAQDAHHDVAQPVPLHLRNAPTTLMKELEYGKGYRYAHDEADAVAEMTCLPPALEGRTYYEPKERGFEKEIKRRLDGWAEIKKRRKGE